MDVMSKVYWQGTYPVPTVCIASVDVPFERTMNVNITIGGRAAVRDEPSTVTVELTDLTGAPVDDLRVHLVSRREGEGDLGARLLALAHVGEGVYESDDLRFEQAGIHTLTVVVDRVDVRVLRVDVAISHSLASEVPVVLIPFSLSMAIVLWWLHRKRSTKPSSR